MSIMVSKRNKLPYVVRQTSQDCWDVVLRLARSINNNLARHVNKERDQG